MGFDECLNVSFLLLSALIYRPWWLFTACSGDLSSLSGIYCWSWLLTAGSRAVVATGSLLLVPAQSAVAIHTRVWLFAVCSGAVGKGYSTSTVAI